MKVTLITTDGVKTKENIASFCDARKMICHFKYESPAELVPLRNGSYFLIDEEGKLKKSPLNELASEIARENESIFPSDYIVGNVLLIDDMDEFDNLPFE